MVEEEEVVALDAVVVLVVECQGEVRVDFRLEDVIEEDLDEEAFPDC